MRYLYLLFCLLCGSVAFAQPSNSATFKIPNVEADNNTEICLPVTVDNFSSGVEFSFAIQWVPTFNGGALTFERVQSLNPMISNFDMSDFNLTQYVNDGLITVQWGNYLDGQTCDDALGTITLPDGTVMFEICFTVSGAIASNHPITFFDKPDDDPFDGVDDAVDVIFNKPPQCATGNDAFPGTEDGSVTIGVLPLILDIPTPRGIFQPGDPYCVDVVAVSGFDALIGYQFGIVYDTTVLRAVSATANMELPQNNDNGYNTFLGEAVYGIWAPFPSNPQTLPEDTRLVTVCFDIVGDCGDRTDVTIGEVTARDGVPRVVDANGEGSELQSVPVITGGTRLIIDNCNPNGFDVVLDCPDEPVRFGDTDVCVDVRAGDDFEAMREFDYLINFNSDILEFVEITNRNPALGLDVNRDFGFDEAANGVISLYYAPNGPRSLPEGEIVFTACFNAVGFGGTSPIVVSRFQNRIESDAFNFRDGLNPTNCAITVEQPDGVAVNFPDAGFSSTQDNCFDITGTGFTDVTGFTIYTSLPTSNFEYRSFSSTISGVTGMEFAPGTGIAQIDFSGPARTFSEGEVIGSVCYRAQNDATPGDCETLGLSAIIPSEVRTTESGGNSLEVSSIDGEACVLFPNGFGLIVSNVDGFINDEVCVPVSVTRFTDVTEVTSSFVFDPTQLTFSRVELTGANWPGLTVGDFDASNAATGRININWTSGTPGGTNIVGTDTVQVFELCFQSQSNNNCSDVEGADVSLPSAMTASGAGSIIYGDGEVCLEDRLFINSVMPVPASCAGEDDGIIKFDIAPRPNNEDIVIRASGGGAVRFGNNGCVTGLLPGPVEFVLYNSSGSVRMEGETVIGVNSDNAAVANAGNDGQLSCGDSQRASINGRNNVGVNWNLFIVQPNGTGTRFVDRGTVGNNIGNVFAPVTDPGTYILEVISEAGCSDRDTVVIAPASNPVAVANDTGLDCNPGGSNLSGEGSSEPAPGLTVTYLWERVNLAGVPIDTIGITRDVMVTLPGLYRLTVFFPTLQCSTSDMARVRDENNLPSSTLPTEAALNCDDSPLELTTGPREDDVVYSWTRSGDPTELSSTNNFTTSELGVYVARLTNQVTGCVRSDTIDVIPSRGVPVLPADMDGGAISCNPDTTVLDIAFEGVGPDTRYRWSSDDGRVVITDQSLRAPRIVLPGTYKVVVSNGVCQDSAEYVVTDPVFPTNVEAGEDGMLDCQEDFQLSATADDADLEFEWFLDGMPVPMGAAATVVVNQPGTYRVVGTDPATGCTATDSTVLGTPAGFPEYMLADTIGGLGCTGTSVRVSITGSEVNDYEVVWTAPDGTEAGSGDNIRVSNAGIYRVNVANTESGCSSVDSVLVVADGDDLPFVSFRQNNLDITCETGPALIDASGSSRGPEFTYTWAAVVDGEEPNEQGNDTLRVRTAGTYSLTILNTASGCSNSREMFVTDSRVFPVVEALDGTSLDCENRMTTIGINILDQPNDYEIQWSGPFGVTDLPSDTNRIAVTVGGSYNAVVINPISSCVTIVPIMVEDLIDSIATLAIMMPDSFDCNNATITLDASTSELNDADPANITWTSFNGNAISPATGSLVVSVNGPGDYELSIMDVSGCTVRDTVSVFAAENTPFAQAGESQEISCGDTPQLDGSGSSPGPLPGILYSWTAIAGGGEIISGGSTSMPFVSGAGTYQLVVSNLTNGCADTSLTTVTLGDLEAADAGEDLTTCDPTVLVSGNQPPGVIGVWTAFDDEGSVWTAEGTDATVTEIGDGLSLVWTLSVGMECENYSADTVRIGPEEGPMANDDLLLLTGENNIGTIDLTANDMRTGPVTVTLLTEPSLGEIVTNLNGQVTFEVPEGSTGVTTIDYEICSNVCTGLCDRATLTIRSEAEGVEPVVYNAITPNGDGMNDVFVFDILDFRPDEFPDNEIVIFNRWGDVIYEAAPYNNDWAGTGTGGNMIPDGTYYYILRLNVGEGEIIRGDVTVIR